MTGVRDAILLTEVLNEMGPWNRVSRRQLLRVTEGGAIVSLGPGQDGDLQIEDRVCVLRAEGGDGGVVPVTGEVTRAEDLLGLLGLLGAAAVSGAPTRVVCLRLSGREAGDQWNALVGAR